MRFKPALAAAALISFTGLLSSGASAAVIFEQLAIINKGFVASDFDTNFQLADDFQLQSGASTITDVHWWGAYAFSNTPTKPDDFTIRIFADISGAPGTTPLHEFAVGSVSRVDTGTNVGSPALDVYFYSVNIAAVTLSANTTYWLSIVNNTVDDTDDTWVWSASGSGNMLGRTSDTAPWSDQQVRGLKVGFQLTNDALAVPEPATWALFAAGLAGLGWISRRPKLH